MATILPKSGSGSFEFKDFDVSQDKMEVWDKGVFLNELLKQGLVSSNAEGDQRLATQKALSVGTYNGTAMALTEIYSMREEAAASEFDTAKIEPIVPMRRELEEKRKIFRFSDSSSKNSNGTSDRTPPHLYMEPSSDGKPQQTPGNLFDAQELQLVGLLAQVFSFAIPEQLEKGSVAPFVGPSISDCEKYNRDHPSTDTDIMHGSNIGDLEDWYSDAKFAQQHLSGVNPTSIEVAPAEKVKAYLAEAKKQNLAGIEKLLSEGKDLLIQDYSYFREATKVGNDQDFESVVVNDLKNVTAMVKRYACASVVLFQLHEDGRLHPLAITLDYKGSLERSVTIFNRRLTPDDKGDKAEKDDWPWRYAKTCAQTADWARHQIAVHLTNTHMIEEGIIVATNRTVPESELLYELLSPHWFRTLPLNSAAREIMIPAVVCRLAGFGPSMDPRTSKVYDFCDWSFKNFNFQDGYIPNDLKKRGFDLEDPSVGDKYRNYPYASLMYYIWGFIREFVKTVLETKYTSDDIIAKDTFIADWCKEIQGPAQITSFPTITTVDQLIDAVTMCIHIASTQHTAVNYLQDYYYSFVPSKPAALCTPLPKDLKTLQSYTEKELTAALPIGSDGPKWKDWLLSAQLPKLLSFKVEARYNLITYAKSLYNVNKSRTNFEKSEYHTEAIKTAAAKFYSDLKNSDLLCDFVSASQTEGTVPYPVLKPELTAVSILI